MKRLAMNNFSDFEHSFNLFNENLKCPICLDNFLHRKEDPYVLPCGHTIGNLCVEKILNTPCPQCQEAIPNRVSMNYTLASNIESTIVMLERKFLALRNAGGEEEKPDSFKYLESDPLYESLQNAEDSDAVEFVLRRWLHSDHTFSERGGNGMTLLHRAIVDKKILLLKSLAEFPEIDEAWKISDDNGQTPLDILALKVHTFKPLWYLFHSKRYFPRILPGDYRGSEAHAPHAGSEQQPDEIDALPVEGGDVRIMSARFWYTEQIEGADSKESIQEALASWLAAGRTLHENFGSGNTFIHKAIIKENANALESLKCVDKKHLVQCFCVRNSERYLALELANMWAEIPPDLLQFLGDLKSYCSGKEIVAQKLQKITNITTAVEIRLELFRLIGEDQPNDLFTMPIDSNGNTLLHAAIIAGNISLIEVIGMDWSERVNLNAENYHGQTVRALAAASRTIPVRAAILKYFYPAEYAKRKKAKEEEENLGGVGCRNS